MYGGASCPASRASVSGGHPRDVQRGLRRLRRALGRRVRGQRAERREQLRRLRDELRGAVPERERGLRQRRLLVPGLPAGVLQPRRQRRERVRVRVHLPERDRPVGRRLRRRELRRDRRRRERGGLRRRGDRQRQPAPGHAQRADEDDHRRRSARADDGQDAGVRLQRDVRWGAPRDLTHPRIERGGSVERAPLQRSRGHDARAVASCLFVTDRSWGPPRTSRSTRPRRCRCSCRCCTWSTDPWPRRRRSPAGPRRCRRRCP